jgi:hypothetical protein
VVTSIHGMCDRNEHEFARTDQLEQRWLSRASSCPELVSIGRHEKQVWKHSRLTRRHGNAERCVICKMPCLQTAVPDNTARSDLLVGFTAMLSTEVLVHLPLQAGSCLEAVILRESGVLVGAQTKELEIMCLADSQSADFVKNTARDASLNSACGAPQHGRTLTEVHLVLWERKLVQQNCMCWKSLESLESFSLHQTNKSKRKCFTF